MRSSLSMVLFSFLAACGGNPCDEYVEYWLEHFLVLEGCRYTDNGRKLQAVDDFVVAVWENEESEGYVPCNRLLACYASNTDWV